MEKKVSIVKDFELVFEIKKFSSSIKRIGSDLKFSSFMCYASSGWIPVTFGMPSILVQF